MVANRVSSGPVGQSVLMVVITPKSKAVAIACNIYILCAIVYVAIYCNGYEVLNGHSRR